MNKWRSKNSALVKRILTVTLALGLIIGATYITPILTSAADKVDLTAACSLKVNATNSQDQDFLDDLVTADVVVDLYQVAEATPLKRSDGYEFKLLKEYDNSGLKIADKMDGETWSELAQEAAAFIKKNIDAGTPIAVTKTINAGDTATDLDAGLYLVLARGSSDKEYFSTVESTKTKADGTTETVQTVVTIATGYYNEYTFLPEFTALPTKEPDKVTGEINTANDTPWIYKSEIVLKPSFKPILGSLKITKGVQVYEKSEPTICVFYVDIYTTKNGVDTKIDSRVETLVFTDAKEEYTIVDDIPVGAKVYVYEDYPGCNYICLSPNPQDKVIKADEIVEVEFINTFDDTIKHCGSITNIFDPARDENGNLKYENGELKYNWTCWRETYKN